jgi:ethanolamine utilization microcompartment shell protein EutL
VITGRIIFAGKTTGDVKLALEQALAALENGHRQVKDGDDDHAYALVAEGDNDAFGDVDAMRALGAVTQTRSAHTNTDQMRTP